MGGGERPILLASHQAPRRASSISLCRAPMTQIGRVGNPHVRPQRRHGTMNQRPVSVDSPRQKGGVFVIGRHDDAVALETSEVFGQSQRHSGAATRIRGVGDRVLLQLGHESDARIFDAPDFLGIFLRAGHQRRFAINLPAIHAVDASGRRKDATSRAGLRCGTAAAWCHPAARWRRH